MSLLAATLLLVLSVLPAALAQDESTPHIDGAQSSKVAITGAIIGGILLLLACIATAVYGIDRCMSRRRAKAAKFAPLPTLSEDDSEPYRYLATRPAKTSYGRGPFYPGSTSSNPTSPARSSTYGGASPAHSPGAQSLRFDPYGHGPFYPGTPPASPNAQVSSPRTPLPPSPLSPSFRSSQSTLYVSSPVAYRNVALSPLPLRNDHLRGSESSSTLSRATSTIPGIDTAVTSP